MIRYNVAILHIFSKENAQKVQLVIYSFVEHTGALSHFTTVVNSKQRQFKDNLASLYSTSELHPHKLLCRCFCYN